MRRKDHKGGTPQQLAVKLLRQIYSGFSPAERNMSEDQFVRESLGHLRDVKKRKKSPLILPN